MVPVISSALDSQGKETQPDKEVSGTGPSRKRKSSSDTKVLEWMPPQSFDDTPAPPGEPSLCHPRKRLRSVTPALYPTVLSLDEDLPDDQTACSIMNSVMFSPPYSLSIENDDKCTDFDGNLFPSYCTIPNDKIDSFETEDVNDDTLFDQYLRSPSPSLSPTPSVDDAASELSGATLIDAGRDQSCGSLDVYTDTETLKSPPPDDPLESEVTQDREDRCRPSNGSRIHLRVTPPKITLRFKIQNVSQSGKKKGERAVREKEKKGTKTGMGKRGIKREEKKGTKRAKGKRQTKQIR